MRDPATRTTPHGIPTSPEDPAAEALVNWWRRAKAGHAAGGERRQPRPVRDLGAHASGEGATGRGQRPGAVPARSDTVGVRRERRALANPRVGAERRRALRRARLVLATASVALTAAFVVFAFDHRTIGTGIDLLVVTGLYLVIAEALTW